MHSKDKKLTVLHQLSQETEPVGLVELVRKLGNGYFERSVRRWLSEMITEGLVVQRARHPKRKINSGFGEESVRSFDEIRVRYREARQAILRDVVLNMLSGTAMKTYISERVGRIANAEDRASLFEDVLEDIQYIDLIRIVGTGIIPDQLASWQRAQSECIDKEKDIV